MPRNPIPITVGARTDVGRVREHNEDSMLVATPLLVVADGVGGCEAGEVASRIVVETMDAQGPRIADAARLEQAVVSANAAVLDGVRTGAGRPGMASTMTAAVIEDGCLMVAQVGDSRAYLLRDGSLTQLTHDHSLVAAMVESGQLTEEQARRHPDRSVITRALGSDPRTMPDVYSFDVEAGDRVLLCSDGLCGLVPGDDICRIMASDADPQRTADALVDAANDAGGSDNITVIVADVGDFSPVAAKGMFDVFAPSEADWEDPEQRPYEQPSSARPDGRQAERRRGARQAGANRSQKRSAEASRRASGSGGSKVRRRVLVVVVAVVFVALIGCACGGIYFYMHNSAYLIEQDGKVALYDGRLDDLAGYRYSEFQRLTDIEVADLPINTAAKLEEGVQFGSMDAALDAIADYEKQAELSKQESEGAATGSGDATSTGDDTSTGDASTDTASASGSAAA